jgi:hypothetical protein
VTVQVITHLVSTIPCESPRNAAGSCKLRYKTLRQFSRKQCFITPAQIQRTHVQMLCPKNKGVSPYVHLQAGYRCKKQGLIHIWLYKLSFSNCLGTCRGRSTRGNKDRRTWQNFQSGGYAHWAPCGRAAQVCLHISVYQMLRLQWRLPHLSHMSSKLILTDIGNVQGSSDCIL